MHYLLQHLDLDKKICKSSSYDKVPEVIAPLSSKLYILRKLLPEEFSDHSPQDHRLAPVTLVPEIGL